MVICFACCNVWKMETQARSAPGVSSMWLWCSLIKYLHFWVEIVNYPIIKYEGLITF